MMIKAKLILEDGTEFCGWSFGAERNVSGEVVFNTAMTGYPESLTDPSYAGQILVSTYPLIGNYGVPETGNMVNGLPLLMESERIHAKALIVADYSESYSHWNAKESLASWLKRENIPAITGIDTRRLTMLIREHGVMMGRIEIQSPCPTLQDKKDLDVNERYECVNWVAQVSCKEIITYQPVGEKRYRVVLVDCGVKANIIRCLLSRGIEVVRVPWDYNFNTLDFDGLFLANGPGDPEQCQVTIGNIRDFLSDEKVRPCMGICLGNQLLACSAGAKTYKLKYGHRSHNQPVQRVGTQQCFITSQNHGYAVDDSTLPEDWEPLFVNMNDGSNEGIRHKTKPWMSAQFHPEACSGPVDTEFLFDEFVKMLDDVGGCGIKPSSNTIHPQMAQVPPFHHIKKVLLLGSGALKIGQAGEFDYSGAQALKALKEEGVRSVLINPNIATVQTSKDVADTVYFQPVQSDFVERVIEKERPDGILLSFGGQTALNCGVELYRKGVLEKYGVEVLGTPVQAIIDTEDRDLFVQRLDEIDVKTIKSEACSSVEEVQRLHMNLAFRSSCALPMPLVVLVLVFVITMTNFFNRQRRPFLFRRRCWWKSL